MSITYIPLPQTEELTSREKEDSIGAYLIMFAAFAVSIPLPIVNSIAAIIYFYINRKKPLYSFSLPSITTVTIANNPYKLGYALLGTTNFLIR
tara:strand:- start:557 stop:835 length:279 start_codon:yes stop_codon:yes gene_type:complete